MSERHFEIATTAGLIRGMVHIPKAHAVGAAVLLHGYFSANRVGPARLFVEMARALCMSRFRVYRADVIGVGDSDGRFEDITFETELRDVRKIVEYASIECPTLKMIAIGHSMGANLTLRIAIEFPSLAKLILIAPDLVPRGGVDQLFTPEQLVELKATGWTIRKGLHINNTFVEELRGVPALRIAAELDVPVAVLQGTADELYDGAGAEALAHKARAGRFIQISGGDHNFLRADARLSLFQAVIRECEEACPRDHHSKPQHKSHTRRAQSTQL